MPPFHIYYKAKDIERHVPSRHLIYCLCSCCDGMFVQVSPVSLVADPEFPVFHPTPIKKASFFFFFPFFHSFNLHHLSWYLPVIYIGQCCSELCF